MISKMVILVDLAEVVKSPLFDDYIEQCQCMNIEVEYAEDYCRDGVYRMISTVDELVTQFKELIEEEIDRELAEEERFALFLGAYNWHYKLSRNNKLSEFLGDENVLE